MPEVNRRIGSDDVHRFGSVYPAQVDFPINFKGVHHHCTTLLHRVVRELFAVPSHRQQHLNMMGLFPGRCNLRMMEMRNTTFVGNNGHFHAKSCPQSQLIA